MVEQRHWGDGMPVVPPTTERVSAMLQHVSLAREHVVAAIAPAYGAATVECIAANAVMAGCRPEYMPLLLAAVRAVADPHFHLQSMQATTNPVAVALMVNG